MDIIITSESTEEEVLKFFVEKANISEDMQTKLKKESITGEVLPLLDKEDFSNYFGFKYGNTKKWTVYYEKNKDKFTPKEIKERINQSSTEEEVKNFFERCLDFKGPLENINGKKLLELTEEEMKKIGLNLGKRKKLTQYIKYFITLIPKESAEDEIDNIPITRTSSRDEVNNFLKFKLKISQDSIDELQLDAESLLELEEDEIDGLKVITKDKEQLKKFIKRLKSSEEPQKNITKESSVQDVANFLEKAFGIPKNTTIDLGIDGEAFLTTTEEDINDFNISEEQKNSWKKYINELNSINETSSKEVVKNFLQNKLSFSDNSVNQMDFDGKSLLKLKEYQIKNLNINDEEKNKLKTYLKKDQIRLINEKDEKSISEFLDDKFGLSIETFNDNILETISNLIKSEEKNILEKYILSKVKAGEGETLKKAKPIREVRNHLSKEKKFSNLKDYKLVNFVKNNNYNIIFFIALKENDIKDYCLSIYEEYEDSYLNHKPKYIYDNSFQTTKNEWVKVLFIHIQSEIPFKNKVNIYLNKYEIENHAYLNIDSKIKWFYNFSNLNFDNYNVLEELKIHHIIFFYYDFIFGEKKNFEKAIKVEFLKDYFEFVNTTDDATLYADTFLNIFKQSLALKVEPKNINSIKIHEIEKNKEMDIQPKDYLTADDIDKLKLEIQKSKFIEYIVIIYAKTDIKQLLKLIQSKSYKKYCRMILNLVKDKKLFRGLFLEFRDKAIINTLEKNLLSVSNSKDDINFILSLAIGLSDNLKFIKENFNEIYKILDSEHSLPQFLNFYSYTLYLLIPHEKDTIDDIIINFSQIVKITKEKNYKPIIDYNEEFDILISFYGSSNRKLSELCKIHNYKNLVRSDLKDDLIIIFYEKIHSKGISLIRNGMMKMEEIATFITTQDIFYFSERYRKSEKRDPKIFDYIHITDDDKNYLNNLKIIEEKQIMKLFNDLNIDNEEKLYKTLLNQMKKIRDFKSIFQLFPTNNINMRFAKLINEKFGELIYFALDDVEHENIIYYVFDKVLIINEYNVMDLNPIVEKIQMKYDFTSKYYKHLLDNKYMTKIVELIKGHISNFFISQYNSRNLNAESIISMLLISKDIKISTYFLDELEKNIITENDFYYKDENLNYQLFKQFLEKCSQLIKNKEIYNGTYLVKTIQIQSKLMSDLLKCDVEYERIDNLIISNKMNEFFERMKVIFQNDENAKNALNNLIKNYSTCERKIIEFNKIEEFYNTFYKETQKKLIEKIKERIKQCKEKKISELIKIDNLLSDDEEFNFEQAKKEAEMLKYKKSCFFMAIFTEIDRNEKTEDEIFKESISEFHRVFEEIINQKESKKPFFKIDNVEKILNQLKNPNNDIKKEIKFLENEFDYLKRDNYIKQNLEKDLKNFSNKYKILKLIKGITTFIDAFSVLHEIKKTEFFDNLNKNFSLIESNEVKSAQITNANTYLKKFKCDVDKETSIIIFYQMLIDKEESINFIKTIKDINFEIRNLSDFIDDSASELQISDIENLIYVYSFYIRIINNKKISTDQELIEIFNDEYIKDKNIAFHMQNYLKTYGEIINMYNSIENNQGSTIDMIENLLKHSSLELFKDKESNSFIYTINKKNINELEELRNKILMTNANKSKQEKETEDDKQKNKDKAQITKEYVSLLDNIKQLNKTLNNLVKSGYPDLENLSLQIEDSQAKDKKNNKNLEKIIEEYMEINKNFQKNIKNGYEKYPLLRLFYGEQFIKLNEAIKSSNNIDKDIIHLINSVALNMINDIKIDFKYDQNIEVFENINSYLNELFKKNNINLEEIYKRNQVLENIDLEPGLYRKVKYGDNDKLINIIIDVYLNLTNNLPIINTLLLCNEETTIQKIKSFLYRALFCDKPVLFLIANMEFLDLSTTRKLVKTLKYIIKILKSKNKKINSYILFIYENKDSGLVRDLGKLIPERNILNDIYINHPEKLDNVFNKNELYLSKFSGYGKTTEIKYKVKSMGNNAKYVYFPLGGSFTRKYVLDNLMKHELDSRNGKSTYLHLDLSYTDNVDLMSEILFKLIILRYLDSNEKLYYLGHDLNIIIEIPNGFVKFEQKYKLLDLFKKEYIEELKPLRLEENVKLIKDSPISIVAEVLTLYDSKEIETKNINLEGNITMSAAECEKIINKYFNVKNQNYYQKMNFIKILSNQFKSFTESGFFFYEEDSLIKNVIKKSRYTIITNFIKLTTVFTQSPFDSILTMQEKTMKIMGDYNENKAIDEGIMALADEKAKKEIFSFKKIEPNLVFFNADKATYSIISNNDKTKDDYKDLKLLWNSQKVAYDLIQSNFKNINKIKDIISYKNLNNLDDLIDYKNMTHEGFLVEIKKIFNLESMQVEQLEKLCEDLGNYIFVSDNFIKMIRILLNIEAKIPVILMGETGVGKTKLLEMLVRIIGKGEAIWKKLEIHAGIKDEDIINFIEQVNIDVEKEKKQDETIWIFFDEINTCNSLGLITEIMCNHTYLGKEINKNFVFLGACNPYRILTKKMRESGLVYYNLKEKNKLNNLVYTVNPLPYSLLNFIFDFGSLQKDDEEKYIINTIKSILSKMKKEKIIENINKKQLDSLTIDIFKSICISHDFLREIYDKSSVSLREIRRFGIFFEYFIKYFKSTNFPKNKKSMSDIMKLSLNMTIYLCYYLRINDKQDREKLANNLAEIFKSESSQKGNFTIFPEIELATLTKAMEKDEGIALNRALKENLYTCYTCIEANIPLIIIGKPGTGKSLSFNILYNTLKGENSSNPIFRDKGKLYRHYYQGSETSTSEGIKKVFEKAKKDKNNNKNKNTITLVFFDEMGLAERSSNNPLKIMHSLLERDSEDSVPFLGISNWRLDAAKINRALNLSITEYDDIDLKDTAYEIAYAFDNQLANNYRDFFETLAMTYKNYLEKCKELIKENKDFHGNRDFYTLIKTAIRELMDRKNEISDNESKVLTEVAIISLNRNFGGLEESSKIINKIFKELYSHKYDDTIDFKKGFSVLSAIKKNLLDSNSRYLMLISEGNDASDILKYVLNSLKKNYIELVGSNYKSDIKSGRYSEEILNKIKYIMESPNILIMKDLDVVYPSLYDLFNQNFTNCGDKKFARIAFEYAKVSSQVNKDFHAVVIVNKNQIEQLKMDPPFLNRFEKHIINFNMLLGDKDIDIAKKIYDFIKLISSFNEDKKLKIDLDKLLVNCERHNIEGLIFKIKNDYIKGKSEEEIKKLEGEPEYEDFIIKESFKKITPTFCQDIIASMKYSNLYQKDNELYQIILNYYKESNKINFMEFFKNIESRKNIIFTFSKITENLFENNQEIKNKYGVFNNQSTSTEMIETIQCENDLIFLLKSFTNSKNKNLLAFKFAEKDLNKINSINYVISNFEKEYPKLKDKLLVFIIHKQRATKNTNNKDNKDNAIKSDLIPFINEEYYQIFIDNLQGQKNSILEIINNKDETAMAKEYINNSEFLDKKLYTVLNYFKYNILFETENLNTKNFTLHCAEKILNNEKLKELFLNNLQKQGKAIQDLIKNIFTTDIDEINDVDFFEIINSKLSVYFCRYLLNILNYSIEKDILCPLLNNDSMDIIFQNDLFNNIITEVFDEIKFKKKLIANINANKIKLYNGLKLPGCREYLNKIYIYFNSDKFAEKFEKCENSLRKCYKATKKINEVISKYNEQQTNIEKNLKTEINKYPIFKETFNQNDEKFKQYIIEDYLIFFIIKFLEAKKSDYITNQNLLSFLKFIVKMKLSGTYYYKYEIKNTLEEFIRIILFIQGYKEEIKNFLEIFMQVIKYCSDIEERMKKVLDDEKIKDEVSDRNQEHSKKVNLTFFYIIESFIKAILSFSVELIENDNAKFYDFFYNLPIIETIFQKINKKLYLYSKEIYNIRSIIKIEEALKQKHEYFENNYKNIMNILFQQSISYYEEKFGNLFDNIIELVKFFDDIFKEKNEDYNNLIFFIFRQQYKNNFKMEIKVKLAEYFFQTKSSLKKSKIFISELFKDLKPEIFNNENKDKESKESLLKNFMNLELKKLNKFQKLFEILNKIDSQEFNEILLYFFEEQCQSYFLTILENNDNKYTEKCCKELLLDLSLDYLKKSIEYLYSNKNNNNNNLLKFYAIGYVKTYIYFYVQIHYKEFDKCVFDDINKLLYAKDEENESLIKIRNIYIWRVYCKHFQNFEKFKNNKFKDLPNIQELNDLISKDNENAKYIFKENFITPKCSPNYLKMVTEFENINTLNFDNINQNFDLFFCVLINKVVTHIYGDDSDIKNAKDMMKKIYDISKDKIRFKEEGTKLFEFLLDENLFQNEIVKKISDENPFTLQDFEILLYSLRFIFNTQINNEDCFYNHLLMKDSFKFIQNNYIPGSFPILNEYIKSYNILSEKLKQKINMGYYICKDCGYLYEVKPCTFPMVQDKCPNGHVIGGLNHVLTKKDLRIFYEDADYDSLYEKWTKMRNDSKPWLESFLKLNLHEFKTNYVDKYIVKPEKGIIKDYENNEFEKSDSIRNMDIISFRVLNFVLYSFLLGAYILKNLSKNEANNYLVENLFPHSLFGIIKKNWKLLDESLKEKGIENIQSFLNMIFEEIIEKIKKLKRVDTLEKLSNFETDISQYINTIITSKEKIEELNKGYQSINDDILALKPDSIKEIILEHYPPSKYDQKQYPDIQYYYSSEISNFDTFIRKFKNSRENEDKYALINMLINKDEELIQNALKLKNLLPINNLTNILLDIYSYKISREEGETKILKNELKYIEEIMNDEPFQTYVDQFLKSWNEIKEKCTQYKCRSLVDKQKEAFNLNIGSYLTNFLVDDGVRGGGMFLASAYENLISWQNNFIDSVINKNKMSGVLNCYVPQLEQNIDIQEAKEDEIILIDNNTYNSLNDLIRICSMRNIIEKEDKINYEKYNDIIYNFDFIEEELAKLILPGKKRFKNTIRFVTYLYEGFRGGNSAVLAEYLLKYPSRELYEAEKDSLIDFISENKSRGIYNDVFSSLQILMNEIVKENYEPSIPIYEIIIKLPKVVTINSQIVKLLQEKYLSDVNQQLNLFSINSLVPFLEYFETLCWEEIKQNICEDYKINLSDQNKKHILDYFEKNKNPENLINKKNATVALRKLLSRFIAGRREEVDIKPNAILNNYMKLEYLWDNNLINNIKFEDEISKLFKDDILIENAFTIFNLLEGENLLNEEIKKEKKEKELKKEQEIKVEAQIIQEEANATNPNPPQADTDNDDEEEEEKEDS